MRMPMELANEMLEGPAEDLEMAAAMLDSEGWDRSGQIVPATRQRVLIILAPLREEVLELSSGTPVADWAPQAQ